MTLRHFFFFFLLWSRHFESHFGCFLRISPLFVHILEEVEFFLCSTKLVTTHSAFGWSLFAVDYLLVLCRYAANTTLVITLWDFFFCGKSLAPVLWACASFNTKRLPAGQFVSATTQRSRAPARVLWHGASRLQNGIDSDGMWPVNCPPWSAAGKWISVSFCSRSAFRWIPGAKLLLFMISLLTSSVNTFNANALDSIRPCWEWKDIDG